MNINSEVVQKILSTARFAPSSHNTQPWTVRLAADTLIIGFLPTRQLFVGDPENRELAISLGCFIETLLRASTEYGLKGTFSSNTKPGNHIVGQITFEKVDPDATGVNLILSRRSDRRFYENQPLGNEDIACLTSLTAGNSSLKLYTESTDIAFLGKMTHQATLTAMTNPAFRAELAGWVRNNWTKQSDGMPAYTQGMPGPISLIAPFVIKKNKAVAKDQAKKDWSRVLHSAAIGLICVENEDRQSLIEAGRLFVSSCLEAEGREIKTAAVSAAVIDRVTREKIQKKFDLKSTPVAFLRFGYAKKIVKPSPRRTVEDILTF